MLMSGSKAKSCGLVAAFATAAVLVGASAASAADMDSMVRKAPPHRTAAVAKAATKPQLFALLPLMSIVAPHLYAFARVPEIVDRKLTFAA